MPTGRPEADRATVRIPSGAPGAVPRLTGTPDRGSSWRSSSGDSASPGRGGDLQPVAVGHQQGDPGHVEHGRHGLDDGLEQLLDGALLHQQLGQLEEPAGLGRPLQASARADVQVGHDPGHQAA